MFTEQEVAYLKSQHLARIATVSGNGQPDVSPVGFEFDGKLFYIGGRNVEQTRKYRNVKSGNAKWPWWWMIWSPFTPGIHVVFESTERQI